MGKEHRNASPCHLKLVLSVSHCVPIFLFSSSVLHRKHQTAAVTEDALHSCRLHLLTMVIAIYNISSTSARVSWPSSPTCIDTFYSVMYDPNWNSLFMGYKRKSFMYEDRIPVSQTSTHLANLLPQTAYFLCVTCQAANPVREQCQVFSTLSDSSEGHDRAGWELAMAVWLICCILLLVIASILLWSCLNNICILPGQAAAGHPVVTNSTCQGMSTSGALYTPRSSSQDSIKLSNIMQSPHLSAQPTGHIITQDHELRTLAKLSGSEPSWINWIKVITALFRFNCHRVFSSTHKILFVCFSSEETFPTYYSKVSTHTHTCTPF